VTLSIRWRLTLWNTLGLAVLLLAFAGFIYGRLRHALYEQIDRKLAGALEELQNDSQAKIEPDQRLPYLIHELQEHESLFVVVYDRRSGIVARTEGLADESLPPAPTVADGARGYQIRAVPSLGRQRVLEAAMVLDEGPMSVIVMAPLDETDHELSELLTVLVTAVPLMLLLSGGLGYVLARKALAPMQRLRQATEQITADRLDRRLPIINSHDELGRLTETFNAMIGRLERSFSEIRRFTADASHELRTPLTAIRTEAEVALGKPLELAEYQQLLAASWRSVAD